MIVPMKKVSLIIMGDKKSETLKELRKLGILQIEIAEGSGEKLDELKEQINLLEAAAFNVGKSKKSQPKEATFSEALEIAKEIASLDDEKKDCQAEQSALSTELDRLKNWGDVDPAAIAQLAEKGIDVSLYETPNATYEALGENVKTIRLETTKSSVKFLLVKTGMEGETECVDSLNGYRLALPAVSTAQMRSKIDDLGNRIKAIDEKVASYADYAGSFKKAVKACEKEVEFEVYNSGMDNVKLSEDGKREVSVSCFKGYIETENVDKLKQTAKENSWGLVIEDPTEEDNVPTKLKNNKLVSLIYPLTDFLGTVPGYFEYDISGWFLLFILIFFGMIFGDGGYGLIITAVAAIPIVKSLASKKPVSPAFLLVGLFGLSTMLWGMLTCTWFGLTPDQLPQWLKSLSIPVISNVYADKAWYLPWTEGEAYLTTAQNLQIFCFTLALVHLIVAHIKSIVRNRKSLSMLGDVGSILQLIGMYYVVLSLVVNSVVFPFGLTIKGIPVGLIFIGCVAVGFVVSFVFANYDGNIVQSMIASVKDIVSVLLGVVNVFADIVSYIRLWAVGLAGSAISATVNELVSPMLGNFMFLIIAIVILVFGHGLNMILNVLSVIVHGIRLNTLEFSGHLNMSWSGHKFKPFEE